MAVTARNALFALIPVALIMIALPCVAADQATQVREQITKIGSALSDGNPTDAMGAFDKSFRDYDKLASYFAAITSGHDVTCEVEIRDEDDQENQTILQVIWNVTLADRATSVTDRRNADVTIRLTHKGGKWKIVEFSPIDIFNPQRNTTAKP